jgi:hypothetical protein
LQLHNFLEKTIIAKRHLLIMKNLLLLTCLAPLFCHAMAPADARDAAPIPVSAFIGAELTAEPRLAPDGRRIAAAREWCMKDGMYGHWPYMACPG